MFKLRRILSFTLSTVLLMSIIFGSAVLAVEPAEDDVILVENGVQVSMSSSAMNPASSQGNTGQAGHPRPGIWWTDDPVPVEFRNTKVEPINLTGRVISDADAYILVDNSITYQTFAGIGASMDHASVWNLMQLTPESRRETLRYMIDPFEGMGLSMFRVPIGTSDFWPSQVYGHYNYYDAPGRIVPEALDWNNDTGSGFSIQKSRDNGLVEVLRTILEEAKDLGIEGEVNFFGTPWSPPGWMKTAHAGTVANNPTGMGGGRMLDTQVENAAMYYVRWLEEYAKEGIPFYGMTMQNQSAMTMNMANFPSCNMTAQQQFDMAVKMRELIANSDILTDAHKNSFRIWGNDTSWQEVNSHTLSRNLIALDTDTRAVSGIGIHDYRANPTMAGLVEITNVLGREALVSERSLNGTFGMDRTVQYFRNGAVSHTHWVTVGSTRNNDGGIGRLQLMVMRNPDRNNEVRFLPEAHITGQFGQIRHGYVRVDSTLGRAQTDAFGISNVTFMNPDTEELVMVVVNNSTVDRTFTVAGDTWQFEATLPATTVATYKWFPCHKFGEFNVRPDDDTKDYRVCTFCGYEEERDRAIANVLADRASAILRNGIDRNLLPLDNRTLTMTLPGIDPIVLSTTANNRNIEGEVYLGDGYYLIFDIKGNGSNVRVFEIVFRG